jgi:hypothetical protein
MDEGKGVMKKGLSAGLSLLFLAAAPEALAWDAEGHQVVAAIAERHLTPEAREGMQALLGPAHLHDRDVAAWADDIRSSQPETRGWHFVDIPLSADTYSPDRDCAGQNCAIGRIEIFSRTLADPSVSREERLTALKFLVHFVGDLHQPLHCIDNNDHGGNTLQVRYPERVRKTDLHEVWDGLVLQDAMGDRKPVDYAEALDATITQADIQAWTSSSSPAIWTNEVHKTAQGLYRELPAANALGRRVLPKGYSAAHEALVEQQLQRGGIRLASVLNKAFAPRAGAPLAPRQSPSAGHP